MATVQEILDTEIPRPTFAFRPGYNAPVPSDVTFSRPSAGQTRNPASQYGYKSVPSGRRRIYGPKQGLLLEGNSSTNVLPYSSNLNAWDGTSLTQHESIFQGQNENAYSLENGGPNQSAGTYTANSETLTIIAEKQSDDILTFKMENGGTSTSFSYDFDFANETFSNNSSRDITEELNWREIAKRGPNGGRLIELNIQYDPTIEGDDGSTRQLRPGTSDHITHYWGIQERDFSYSPVITEGSQATRSASSFEIETGGWHNTKEGSWVLNLIPLFYSTAGGYPALFNSQGAEIEWWSGRNSRLNFDGLGVGVTDVQEGAYEEHKVAFSTRPGKTVTLHNDDTGTDNSKWSILDTDRYQIGQRMPFVLTRALFIPSFLPLSKLELI
jgi:hypothetical protein